MAGLLVSEPTVPRGSFSSAEIMLKLDPVKIVERGLPRVTPLGPLVWSRNLAGLGKSEREPPSVVSLRSLELPCDVESLVE